MEPSVITDGEVALEGVRFLAVDVASMEPSVITDGEGD